MKEIETLVVVGGLAIVGFLVYKNYSAGTAAAAAAPSSSGASSGLLSSLLGAANNSGLSTNLGEDISSLV